MRPLAALYRMLSARRRKQFALAIALMVLGALVELLTIGAALPFLALIAAPEQLAHFPLLGAVIEAVGGDPVLAASLLLGAAAIGAAGVRVLLAWYIHRFVTAVGHDLASAIFGRMVRQPYAVYVQRSSSEILAGIDKVQHVVAEVLQPGMQGITATFIAVAITALLVAIDAFAALAAAGAVVLAYALLAMVTRKRLRRNALILSEAVTARVKVVQEGLGGIRDVILDRSQPLFEAQFRRADSRYRRAQSVNAFIASAPRFVVESAGICAIALIAWTMSRQPGGILAAIPVLGALAIGAQRLLPLLHQAYAGLSMSAGAFGILRDVVRLIEAPVVEDVPPEGGSVPPFAAEIRFEDVSYRHREGAFALDGVSFVIPRGARVGVVGPTGSGKSTLLDLLMGLLVPDAGRVTIDGRPLDAATRAGWQAQLAHVPQAVYLADDTIAANIAFGIAPDAVDRERLRQVAASARLDDFLAGLPEGLETCVGERGIRLSGGQRQRIGLARALYRQARVLILDEATNALDHETEQAVLQAVLALDDEITIVMIAHRASSLAGCERLIRLDEGRVTAA